MTTIPTTEELEGRAEQLPLIEPHPTDAKPTVDFYIGTSFTVFQLEQDLLDLQHAIRDLGYAHTCKRPVGMKLCAEEIAKKAEQIVKQCGHLGGVTQKHIQRVNGSAS